MISSGTLGAGIKFHELSDTNFEIKNTFRWLIEFIRATSATEVKISENFVLKDSRENEESIKCRLDSSDNIN